MKCLQIQGKSNICIFQKKKKINLRAWMWVLKATCNDHCIKCTHHVDNLWGYHRSNSRRRVRPAIANISKCWWKMIESFKKLTKKLNIFCVCVTCVFFQREELEVWRREFKHIKAVIPVKKKGGREGVTNEIIWFLGDGMHSFE